MRINHNIAALNTHQHMSQAQNKMGKSMEKLSSGLRINRAADDAAGLSISEKMRGQIRGLEQGAKNAQDGISMLQTAEGGMNEAHAILQRMRELAVQSSNDTNNDADDRAAIQEEVDQLAKELTRIADTTAFNGTKLLDGSVNAKFHIGADESQNVSITIGALDATTLAVATGTDESDTEAVDFKTQAGADAAITLIDAAIKTVSENRSKVGAMQNRLEHTINNLATSAENLTAAESRIRDVDMAKEIMNQTKESILAQASQAMLAQANQQPQGVLQLLR